MQVGIKLIYMWESGRVISVIRGWSNMTKIIAKGLLIPDRDIRIWLIEALDGDFCNGNIIGTNNAFYNWETLLSKWKLNINTILPDICLVNWYIKLKSDSISILIIIYLIGVSIIIIYNHPYTPQSIIIQHSYIILLLLV